MLPRPFRHPTLRASLLIALGAATTSAFAATYSVTNAANGGAGSLRVAITSANANAGADTIQFAIAGTGPHTITLASALPAISDTVTIDGTTQSGYAGTPRIVIAGAGLAADGLTISAANVTLKALAIGGFSGRGLVASGNGLRVESCHVGVNADGTGAAANTGAGILLLSAANAVIGPGNVISANGVDGLRIDGAAASGNIVKGNRIGTNRDGTAVLGNAVNGVVLSNLATANTIGGTTAADLNLISGNIRNGIAIIGGANNNLVARNYIGMAADGLSALANGEVGVLVIDSSANRIGGDVGGTFNVISGNGHHGVELRGNTASSNIVQRNVIGLDVFGTLDRGNGRAGVYLNSDAEGSPNDNRIGGGPWGTGGNLISGNAWAGVNVASATDLLVQGNRIGTDINGTVALANGGGGIEISNGADVVIGNNSAGNLISGNGDSGIDVIDGNLITIVGNRIGTNASGSAALANNGRGIWIRDSWQSALIGGADHDSWTCNRACNLVSGNTGVGIQLGPAQFNPHRVIGNFIGSDLAGTAAIPNSNGVLSNDYAEVGGALAGEGNLISGNNSFGISGDGLILRIFGNRIGTTANGMAALGNGNDGVRLGPDRVHLELGGAAAGQRNVIAGNGGDGVEFLENDMFESANQSVQGNYIGVAADGSSCLGNSGHGLRQSGSEFMLIGGSAAGAGNRIACNGGAGYVSASNVYGVGLLGNLFFSNGALAIDLGGDGVTANDPGDGDVWLDNFPVLTSALLVGATTTVSGVLDAAPGLNYRVEFFSSAACDASGFGEGRVLLTSASISTNASGAAGFSVPLPGSVPAGQVITATATVVSGTPEFPNYSTSEFSACTTVRAPIATLTLSAAASSVGEAAGSAAIIVQRSGDAGHAVSVNYATANGTASSGADYTAANGTLNFAANETQKTLNITIANDSLDEDAETFTLTLNGAGAGAQIGSPATQTVTLNDDDAPPTLSVDGAGCSVIEGDSGTTNCNFVLRLSAATSKTVSFTTATANASALAGSDYSAHTSSARSIAAGQTTLTVAVPVLGDTVEEQDETFSLLIQSIQNASPGSLTATGHILGDDLGELVFFDGFE